MTGDARDGGGSPGGVPPGALRGCRVLVTRPAEQAAPLAAALRGAGATPLLYPTVTVGPPPDWAPFDAALADLGAGDWIVFTSPSAVRLAAARLRERGGLAAAAGATIAAVGPGTAAALDAEGLRAALIPPEGQRNQEGLAAALTGLPAGARVIFPRALGGRDELARQLALQGVRVETVPVSQTRACALPPLPEFDVAIFASPSALRALVESWGAGALVGRITVAIGPVTARAIEAAGLTPTAVAHDPTQDAIVRALAGVWPPGAQGAAD